MTSAWVGTPKARNPVSMRKSNPWFLFIVNYLGRAMLRLQSTVQLAMKSSLRLHSPTGSLLNFSVVLQIIVNPHAAATDRVLL